MLRRLLGRGKPKPGPGGNVPSPPLPMQPPRSDTTLPWGSVVGVVGESFYQPALQLICGHPSVDGYSVDCVAELRPEPGNPHDPAAIGVYVQDHKVGHLSREDARAYAVVVAEAIAEHGGARCAAYIRGGWSRGRGDTGMFGVSLRFSDRTWQVAPIAPDELRLPVGGSISVSNEQEYQEALIDAARGRDLSQRTYAVLAELIWADRNPYAKKDASAVLQVLIDGNVVGFLTPAMSKRLATAEVAAALVGGRRVTCEAALFMGTKAGQDIIEVRLHAPS